MMRKILALVTVFASESCRRWRQRNCRKGKQPPPRPDRTRTERRRPAADSTVTNSVIVPVTVKNKQGQLVGDLQKDDFRVFVDGMEQKILTFTADPFPLSAVILIDNDLPQKQAARSAEEPRDDLGRLRAER